MQAGNFNRGFAKLERRRLVSYYYKTFSKLDFHRDPIICKAAGYKVLLNTYSTAFYSNKNTPSRSK